MTKPYVVGLTGPTGAGKTTVSHMLVQQGYHIIDADLVSRQVVEPGSPCLAKLVTVFGNKILKDNGALDRRTLGGIVFSDREKLTALNQTIFPYIITEINRRLCEYEQFGAELVILDAPTLFESGCDKLCGSVLVVTAPKAIRMERIMARDHLTREQANQRISSQKDDTFYISHADYVLDNGDSCPDYDALLAWLSGLVKQV